MVDGGGGASFPVVFFDGEREINIGNIRVQPMLEFKMFQKMIADGIGISPNQISIYIIHNGSSKEERRKIPITGKVNFSLIIRQKDCFFLVILKRSRRYRGRKLRFNGVDYQDFYSEDDFLPSPPPENVVLLRRNVPEFATGGGLDGYPKPYNQQVNQLGYGHPQDFKLQGDDYRMATVQPGNYLGQNLSMGGANYLNPYQDHGSFSRIEETMTKNVRGIDGYRATCEECRNAMDAGGSAPFHACANDPLIEKSNIVYSDSNSDAFVSNGKTKLDKAPQQSKISGDEIRTESVDVMIQIEGQGTKRNRSLSGVEKSNKSNPKRKRVQQTGKTLGQQQKEVSQRTQKESEKRIKAQSPQFSRVIIQGNQQLTINEADVEAVLGLPRGRYEVLDYVEGKGSEEYTRLVDEMRITFGLDIGKGGPPANKLLNYLVGGRMKKKHVEPDPTTFTDRIYGDKFKRSFVIGVVSSIFWRTRSPDCRFQLMNSLINVDQIKELKWCEYIITTLKFTVLEWKRNSGHYTGPLVFVLLTYIDRVIPDSKYRRSRKFTVIAHWTTDDVNKRAAHERNRNGFGSGIIHQKPIDPTSNPEPITEQQQNELDLAERFQDIMINDMGPLLLKLGRLFEEAKSTGISSQSELARLFFNYTKTINNMVVETAKAPDNVDAEQRNEGQQQPAENDSFFGERN
ncbi:OLC1v1034079C1 [Oldenlandia corymbosa var. corymbosa]|uniref:OLC1v1034079C1 n=1 Tax=Oldenlandia corymbosa var. corymbosa TaxID=529605 RepID=A0AAV1CR07_OLDCO|nr:OLC1v1034079C1 [Oldenlandia corymbosa var. corymbosa]